MEFIIVDQRSEPGRIFAYRVYLVPDGAGHTGWHAKFIGYADTRWGARRKIRRERRRLKRREPGTTIVHREAL
ncbi:hypothetical protein ACFOOK_26485 [Micromonospora krabiensis]|uniref:Uncharacterized protein n=1 Tax=Micromonospora krabiensis TaxID=307121 RepID=A0A1C3N5M6_9ACTN|nr:hypothetical protein [Micromonospora krabiensis]SBV27884.1 hypothetical protein GA0070620_3415 [Micromonospora krabiensis]